MATTGDQPTAVEGTVERVVFRNRDNGYTVLRLDVEGTPLLMTVVGNFQELDAGERVRFSGSWTVDPRHGRQFKAETCLPLLPATVKGIEKFLGSGLVPGIGPVRARQLLKEFGSVAGVKRADAESLIRVVGTRAAEAILEHYRSGD